MNRKENDWAYFKIALFVSVAFLIIFSAFIICRLTELIIWEIIKIYSAIGLIITIPTAILVAVDRFRNRPVKIDIEQLKRQNRAIIDEIKIEMEKMMPHRKEDELNLATVARDGDLATVQALLDDGADPNVKDEDGGTALDYAVWEGYIDIVKALLAKGADVDVKKSGAVLVSASLTGRTDIVKVLLDAGADVNLESGDGRTALQLAAQEGYADILQLLLDKGADVNAKGKDGCTALFLATLYSNKKVILQLLDAGADVNTKNKKGETILMWAQGNGNAEIIKLLKKAGAKG